MTDPLGDVLPQLRAASSRLQSELMVIGAHARDAVLEELGAPVGKETQDVDVVIGVPHGVTYHELVRSLGTPVNDMGFTFEIEGVPVDVLPWIEHLDEAAGFSPARGIVLDVRGQFEVYQSARRVELEPGLFVRLPTAEGLVVLKIIAWNIRQTETVKDARDLHPLLTAIAGAHLDHERVWDADLLERTNHDPDAAAWLLIGQQARLEAPDASAVCAEILATSGPALLRDMGLADTLGMFALRLAALQCGLTEL